MAEAAAEKPVDLTLEEIKAREAAVAAQRAQRVPPDAAEPSAEGREADSAGRISPIDP